MQELTVIQPTYNKAKYVTQTFDSVFAQKTSCSCQVIVTDDCSDDELFFGESKRAEVLSRQEVLKGGEDDGDVHPRVD